MPARKPKVSLDRRPTGPPLPDWFDLDSVWRAEIPKAGVIYYAIGKDSRGKWVILDRWERDIYWSGPQGPNHSRKDALKVVRIAVNELARLVERREEPYYDEDSGTFIFPGAIEE